MKESIGGTQIFMIVITLVLLFTGIMAFTINRSNAFAVKDELVSIIERAGGLDLSSEIIAGSGDATLTKIVEALEHNSYRQIGKCPNSVAGADAYEVAAYQRNGAKVLGNNKAAFCIVKINSQNPVGTPNSYYYQIIVFYTLDLPVIKELFNFKAVGETKALYS
ncbi:MAG: hypothetical protein E7167_03330 [Firmicutes bacterium]|nr:hypothetical protein [Bacillota bacterium]